MDLNRKTAFEVLMDVEKEGAYSNLSLNKFIEKNRPDSPAFVRELVYGVLKNKLLLDWFLEQLVPSGLKKVKMQDKMLLRMGIYQISYMDSVPEYAAVSQTVDMAKKLAKGREKFINGVLRGYIRNRFQLEVPEKGKDFVEYLSVVYSVEKWIVRLWADTYGDEKTEEMLKASNETPELSVRVNVMKTDRSTLKKRLEELGFKAEESRISCRALTVKGTGVLESREYREGLFSVQDEASILVSDILDTKPGDSVADVCAAPGGKTIATAELMAGKGVIYAMDKYKHKLKLMETQVKRAGIDNIRLICNDSRQPLAELRGRMNRVLADVPCSGLGVIRRKPEIKYKGSQDLSELIDTQQQILRAAAEYVSDGGILVYSTCTINPYENEKQIEKFLRGNGNFKALEQKQLLPDGGTDGFFICRMRKEQ